MNRKNIVTGSNLASNAVVVVSCTGEDVGSGGISNGSERVDAVVLRLRAGVSSNQHTGVGVGTSQAHPVNCQRSRAVSRDSCADTQTTTGIGSTGCVGSIGADEDCCSGAKVSHNH